MSEKVGYTPEGQIIDADIARRVAKEETPARRLEKALMKEKETGFSEEQELNMGVVNHVERKYSNASKSIVYEVDGEERRGILVRNDAGITKPGGDYHGGVLLTRNGVFFLGGNRREPAFFDVNIEDFANRIDWTIENEDPNLGKSRAELPSNDKWEEFKDVILIKRSMGIESNKEHLSKILSANEKHWAKVKEQENPPELTDLTDGL